MPRIAVNKLLVRWIGIPSRVANVSHCVNSSSIEKWIGQLIIEFRQHNNVILCEFCGMYCVIVFQTYVPYEQTTVTSGGIWCRKYSILSGQSVNERSDRSVWRHYNTQMSLVNAAWHVNIHPHGPFDNKVDSLCNVPLTINGNNIHETISRLEIADCRGYFEKSHSWSRLTVRSLKAILVGW